MTNMKKWMMPAVVVLVSSAATAFGQDEVAAGAGAAAAAGVKSWASLMGIGAGLATIAQDSTVKRLSSGRARIAP